MINDVIWILPQFLNISDKKIESDLSFPRLLAETQSNIQKVKCVLHRIHMKFLSEALRWSLQIKTIWPALPEGSEMLFCADLSKGHTSGATYAFSPFSYSFFSSFLVALLPGGLATLSTKKLVYGHKPHRTLKVCIYKRMEINEGLNYLHYELDLCFTATIMNY